MCQKRVYMYDMRACACVCVCVWCGVGVCVSVHVYVRVSDVLPPPSVHPLPPSCCAR